MITIYNHHDNDSNDDDYDSNVFFSMSCDSYASVPGPIGSYWPIFSQVEFSRIHKVDRADSCKAKGVVCMLFAVLFSSCLRLEELNTKASSWGALRLTAHSFTLDAELMLMSMLCPCSVHALSMVCPWCVW